MNNLQQSVNRSIRIFISSTFRDMSEERGALMTHTWPELRRFCREHQVEVVEVDLRWGISEEQSSRKETLKLCLDEIRDCRPYFIGLLGERYGWIPTEDAFTADLKEEQPWLKEIRGKSVTELEILNGVLNNPEMAGCAFFYFRDPDYVIGKGADFLSETPAAAEKQIKLKDLIRITCKEKNIPLLETYKDPPSLAPIILEHLKAAIEAQFPIEDIPDSLTREARNHEAFAASRRRTYIGRPDYFEELDRHVTDNGVPQVLLGESGSGKSALLANWVEHWRKAHPRDFIFQHYIGGTPDGAVHWKLMARLISEIKRWTGDPDEMPGTNNDMLRDFPLWLSKVRMKAEHKGVRFIIVMDALNQLEDKDNGRSLGWLPGHSFTGALRLIVSTLPGDTLKALEKRSWPAISIQPLTTDERKRMIIDYLARFSKKLDTSRLDRISAEPAAANPLYLKILLDELRVTGTYEKLDERLNNYLDAKNIAALLGKVLARYQLDYEHDFKGLVGKALGLIWAARGGLAEAELLQLLRPSHLPQLPLATWAPLRSALEEGLIDRGGILNFAHDFLRTAVEVAFLSDQDKIYDFRIQLAEYFENLPHTARTCYELPWLLLATRENDRLLRCLLFIDCFLEISKRDEEELHYYWVSLNKEKDLGDFYYKVFLIWDYLNRSSIDGTSIIDTANKLGNFLNHSAHHFEAEKLFRFSIMRAERSSGNNDLIVAPSVNNLAELYRKTNRLGEAEPLFRRALEINIRHHGKDHPNVASVLNNLAQILRYTNHLKEAEPMMKRAIEIGELNYGKNHPTVAIYLNNLAVLLYHTERLGEAEPLMKRTLQIDEDNFGIDHPKLATTLNNLAQLYIRTNRQSEAEPILLRTLQINERTFGNNHPNVSLSLNNLASLYHDTNRLSEAEQLYLRSIKIYEQSLGKEHPSVGASLINLSELYQSTNRYSQAEQLLVRALQIEENSFGKDHPDVAVCLNHIAFLYQETDRLNESEPLIQRALQIDEMSFGKDHTKVALDLNNLAILYFKVNRLSEAITLIKRVIEIYTKYFHSTGYDHPYYKETINNYIRMLKSMGWNKEQIDTHLSNIAH